MTQARPLLLAFLLASAALPVPGAPLPPADISGKAGGRTDGAPWRSADLLGRVMVVYYVDPDNRSLNDSLYEALKRETFPLAKSQSVAVINMAATLLPDFIIESMLRKKQKQYPLTLYVRDHDRALVKQWGLADQSSCVTVVGADGHMVFSQCGQLNETEIKTCIRLIWEAIGRVNGPAPQ